MNLAMFDLVYSEVHGKLVRFLRWADGDFAIVADRNTLAELPDYVNRGQLRKA